MRFENDLDYIQRMPLPQVMSHDSSVSTEFNITLSTCKGQETCNIWLSVCRESCFGEESKHCVQTCVLQLFGGEGIQFPIGRCLQRSSWLVMLYSRLQQRMSTSPRSSHLKTGWRVCCLLTQLGPLLHTPPSTNSLTRTAHASDRQPFVETLVIICGKFEKCSLAVAESQARSSERRHQKCCKSIKASCRDWLVNQLGARICAR